MIVIIIARLGFYANFENTIITQAQITPILLH